MRTFLITVAVLLILIIAGAAFFGRQTWQRVHEPYKGYTAAEQFVDIPPGTPAAEIRRRLIDAGVVRDELVFRVALWLSGRSRSLQAGQYRFDQPLAPIDVIDTLA